METKTLKWSISGDFITKTAREWFWDEDKDYETCEKLLLSCLINDEITQKERKDIARDIIEGRKRLNGINKFTIEDDGENIRPITDKIDELHRKRKIQEIKDDIQYNPIDYIDIYATVKPINVIQNGMTRYGYDLNQENVREYFICPTNVYDDEPDYDEIYPEYYSPTEAGLWLWEKPELIYTICKEHDTQFGSDVFWKAVYEHTKNKKGFEERNQRYLAEQRLNNHVKTDTKNAKGPQPDDIKSWTGLVAPNGDFYSCEFGEHTSLANKLIMYNPEQFPNEKADNIFIFDKALDILINKYHYTALRYLPLMGEYITFPSNKKITKAQKDTIWEAILKHDIHIKIPDILF